MICSIAEIKCRDDGLVDMTMPQGETIGWPSYDEGCVWAWIEDRRLVMAVASTRRDSAAVMNPASSKIGGAGTEMWNNRAEHNHQST